MYTRKEILFSAVKHCSDFIKMIHSIVSPGGENYPNKPDSLCPDKIYLEAMRLGVDPGTMSMSQLAHTVNLANETLDDKKRYLRTTL